MVNPAIWAPEAKGSGEERTYTIEILLEKIEARSRYCSNKTKMFTMASFFSIVKKG